MSSQKISQEWGAVYAEWLATKGELAKQNANVDQPELPKDIDERIVAISDRMTDAERRSSSRNSRRCRR
jgi:hypothetical protein